MTIGKTYKMKKIILLLFIFIICSCSPAQYQPIQPMSIEFKPTSEYDVDLSKIPKPKKLEPIFVNALFERVPKEEAKYVLLVPKEYGKIAGLLKLTKTYKNIILEQENLVNAHIDILNSMKQYNALEQKKTKQYRDLWVDSENSYRQERHRSEMRDMLFKGTLGFFGVAGVVIAILALI